MVGARGIVVGGTTAAEVRISGNSVRDVVQGIHVGISARRPRNPGGSVATDSAGRVVIDKNVVRVALMPESVVERHGIFVGNRVMFEDMLAAMTVNDIHPIIDKVFDFQDAASAYQYQMEGKHFGKVVITHG